jgi:hypothetical protein
LWIHDEISAEEYKMKITWVVLLLALSVPSSGADLPKLPKLDAEELENVKGPKIKGIVPDVNLSTNVTLQGNTFNGGSQLVQLESDAKLPVLDGSNLTNVGGGGSNDASDLTVGTLDDARLSANVTTQGNTFNAANKLVKLDGSGNMLVSGDATAAIINGTRIALGLPLNAAAATNEGKILQVLGGSIIKSDPGTVGGVDFTFNDAADGIMFEIFQDDGDKNIDIINWQGTSMSFAVGNGTPVLTVLGTGATVAGTFAVNGGANIVYRCVGSTAGLDDDLLASNNTNANHCVGGTWTATSLKVD